MMKEKNSEINYYGFNSSQDVIHLQTKYTIWKRVVNIVFMVTVRNGYDETVMQQAIDKLFERNDCLRIRFVKRNGETLQYFEKERHIGRIPVKTFETESAMQSFIRRFRRKPIDCFKGRTLEAVFAVNPSGEKVIFFKVSHFVADTYGIGILINDLFAVYDALKNGKEMPKEPGSFEKVLKKDIEYKNNEEAKEADRAFIKEYYGVRHKEHPMYCGIHGNTSDIWLREKKKGHFSMPYLFIRCSTESYKFIIPKLLVEKVQEYCIARRVTVGEFFFYAVSVAASVVNDKAPIQAPLELLNCRGTLDERKAAGTKVQSMSVYTTVDYSKSFTENLLNIYEEQRELYRHTRLSYLEIQKYQLDLWKFSPLGQVLNHTYSFIPFQAPDGVSLQVLSNGRCALPAYIAFMHNLKSGEMEAVYDVQTAVVSPQAMVDFQNLLLRVTEAAIESPDTALNELF